MTTGKTFSALILAVAATAVGCGVDQDGDAPPALVDDGDQAELRALEVGDDEPIVDEGDPEPMRASAEEIGSSESRASVPTQMSSSACSSASPPRGQQRLAKN